VRTRIATFVFVAFTAVAPSFAGVAKPVPTLAAHAFPLPVPQYLASVITEASAKYGVDPNLIAAMAFRESRFDANAVSRRGAQGVMQLMPKTARALGVKDAFDARQNVFGGAKYLKYLLDRFDGDVTLTLAAYNAGPELVARVGPSATQEAVEYVAAVRAVLRDRAARVVRSVHDRSALPRRQVRASRRADAR
jgi:soluble lytic murein transglycosylase-like protein